MKLRILGLLLCAAATSAFGAIDSVLLNLVMPDAKVLSGIQVDQSLASPFGQYMLSKMQAGDEDFQKFINATGFDPTHNLHEILAATNSDGSSTSLSAIVLARGAFSPTQILTAAQANGGIVTQYRKFNLIASPDSNAQTAIVFFDTTTAAAGDIASVKAAVDRYLAKATYNTPLSQQALAVSNSNSAWFVTQTPLSQFLNGKLGDTNLNGVSQNNLLQSVAQASGGVQFASSTITLTGDAVTTSAQNAQSLIDVMKFLVSMIPSNDPKIASIASQAQFSVNGTTAHISL
ncbi:MAG TPA: hypothetical protein VKS01_00945, partial [Bryobacteraceae bacterium]|nr:hypothetical protein [Bryobacteraceae bacterium]